MQRMLFIIITIAIATATIGQLVTGRRTAQTPIYADTIMDVQRTERFDTGSMNDVVAFSPADDRIAVGGTQGIYLYDHIDSQPEMIPLHRADGAFMDVTSMLFSLNANLIVVSDREVMLAYDLIAGEIIYEVEAVKPIVLNQDGSLLLYQYQHGIKIVDTYSGELHYDLSYGQEWDEVGETVLSAQFLDEDTQVSLMWRVTSLHGPTGFDGYGSDLWTLSDEPVRNYEDPRLPELQYLQGALIIEPQSAVESIIIMDRLWRADRTLPLIEGDDRQTILHRNLTLTHDSTRFAFVWHGGGMNNIAVWDTLTGERLQMWQVPIRASNNIAFNVDGSLLAIGQAIYDVQTGDKLHTFTTETYLLLDSQSERILHTTSDDVVHLLDATTMTRLSTLPASGEEIDYVKVYGENLLWIELNPHDDNRYALTISLDTGTVQNDFRPANDFYWSPVSPQNDLVVFVSTYQTEIWHLQDAEPVVLPTGTELKRPYFTPQNEVILWNADASEMQFYDIETGTITLRIPVPAGYILLGGIDFSDDAQRIHLSSSIPDNHTEPAFVEVWERTIESPRRVFSIKADIPASDMSADGTHIAVLIDTDATVYDIDTGEVAFQVEVGSAHHIWLREHRLSIIFFETLSFDWRTPDDDYLATQGQRLITTTQTMQFYIRDSHLLRITASDGQTLREIDLQRLIYNVVLSDDQQRLWIGFYDGTVELWTLP